MIWFLQGCYEEKFKNNLHKIFKNKCSEGCTLSVNLENDYVILDGDEIQICLKQDGIKSVDCIIINKNIKGEINLLLCELDRGNNGKSVTDVKKKMEGSGNHIFEVLKEKEIKINKFKCLYLGRYKINPKKPALTRVSIDGVSTLIVNKTCGFELKDSFFA